VASTGTSDLPDVPEDIEDAWVFCGTNEFYVRFSSEQAVT
jgi:hypothetical protein